LRAMRWMKTPLNSMQHNIIPCWESLIVQAGSLAVLR